MSDASFKPSRQSLTQIFSVPAVIAIVSAVGLLAALLGDGLWDAVSWLALAVPVAVALGCVARSRRRSRAS